MAATEPPHSSSLEPPGSFPEELIESQTSLHRAVWERRAEYTVPRTIKVKVGTWNVASIQGTEKDVGAWFVHGKGVSEALSGLKVDQSSEVEGLREQESRRSSAHATVPRQDSALLPKDKDIDLYVLGLQEIVDVASPVEAMRPYHDRAPSERWKSAVLKALPKAYSLIAEQQLVGMYLLIFASSEVASTISNVSCRAVGTGLMGYMGNKGAVAVRLVIGDTTRMVFINSHLSAGAERSNMDRRNWDSSQIVERTRFDPLDHGHGVKDELEEIIGDEDFCFWFGDLNYRLADLPGNDIRHLLMLHTKAQYDQDGSKQQNGNSEPRPSEEDVKNTVQNLESEDIEIDPDQDPTSMQATIASLLPHDELHDQIRKKMAFHDGWQEGKIRFMPTYKYDVGSVGMFDSSEKRRAPSWCDRILYRTRKQYEEFKRSQDTNASQAPSFAAGQDNGEKAKPQNSYDYDPDEDAEDPVEGPHEVQHVTTKSGYEDQIRLEYYTSHQRVLSSDHKPLDAVFQLTYQAVDQKQKAIIYQDVVKDFDRLENESRPSLTIAVDTPEGKSSRELIDYGELHFDRPSSHTLTIANTGRNACSFTFSTDIPWLQVRCDPTVSGLQQLEYRIHPGDALTATVTAHVQNTEQIRSLNAADGAIEDVLIVRISGGRDHFLTIRGKWYKSCFGMSTTELIRTPEQGIRSAGKISDETDIKCSAPRELFRLTEALEASLERAVADWSMTSHGEDDAPWNAEGWPFKLESHVWDSSSRPQALHDVREALDTGKPIDAALDLPYTLRVEVYAETLVRFLDMLQDGIIPTRLWAQLRDTMVMQWEKPKKKSDDDSRRIQIVEIMATSTPHNVSFTLITVMLKRMIMEISATSGHAAASNSDGAGVSADVQEEAVKRKTTQAAYLDVFSGIMFRPREDGSDKEAKRNAARRAYLLELFVEDPSG